MESSGNILARAITKYNPVKVLLLVSGGHDSITNAHICAASLKRWGIGFEIYHGDTTIGIPQTQEYVKEVCAMYGWKLNIRKPPNPADWYRNIVLQHGFPGPTKTAHQFMYRRLKERALRHFVTHECKSDPLSRENVLLASGIRQQESRIRMGYKDLMSKDNSRCWVNPIFYLSEDDISTYMAQHKIPRNPVKDLMCISGECMCGAWAKMEEWIELKQSFPEFAANLTQLHEEAKVKGFPWGWASGPKEWKIEQAEKMQMKFNFMCSGCEAKKEMSQ